MDSSKVDESTHAVDNDNDTGLKGDNKANSAQVDESIEQTESDTAQYSQVTVKLAPQELAHLQRESKVLRLANPSAVYAFRHIKHGWLQRIPHQLSLVCSTLIFFLFFFWYYLPKEILVPGVGLVTNSMPVE